MNRLDHKVTHFPTLIIHRYSRDFLSKLLRDDASVLPWELYVWILPGGDKGKGMKSEPCLWSLLGSQRGE